jgi:hypothetical protein
VGGEGVAELPDAGDKAGHDDVAVDDWRPGAGVDRGERRTEGAWTGVRWRLDEMALNVR